MGMAMVPMASTIPCIANDEPYDTAGILYTQRVLPDVADQKEPTSTEGHSNGGPEEDSHPKNILIPLGYADND